MTTNTTPQSIRQPLDILCESGSVYELRIFGRRGTTSGYYDNLDKLAKDAARYSGTVPAVYITANPVQPELLARAVNRTEDYVKSTTSDNQIVKRRLLPIDFDAQRVSGISSTDEEHEAAIARAVECRTG
jgi:hypothetical protein